MGGRGTEPPEAHSGPLRSLEILPLVPTPGWEARSPSSWAGRCVDRAPDPPLTVPLPITAASAAVTPSGLGASGPCLPYIHRTILYQTCKPSGMLRALHFYEILGSVIVRQTQGLVTNSPPFADAKASPRDAWSPRGWPSSGAVEIDEDSMHPGEINALELRGQDCGASGGSAARALSPGEPAALPHSTWRWGVGWGMAHSALPPAQLGSHLVSGKDRCLSPERRHRVTQGPDSVT